MRKLFISSIFLVVLIGCSSYPFKSYVADQTIGVLTDKKYSRNPANCRRIETSCPNGKYEEWEQSDGKIACVCN